MTHLPPPIADVLALSVALAAARKSEVTTHVAALRRFGANAWPAIPTLLAMLQRSNTDGDRTTVLDALADIGAGGEIVVPSLAAFLQTGPSETVSLATLRAMSRFPSHVPLAIDALLRVVSHAEFPHVTEEALRITSMGGPALRERMPDLVDLATRRAPELRALALVCIAAAVEGDDEVPLASMQLLIDGMNDRDTPVALEAMHTLGTLGVKASEAARDLVTFAESDDEPRAIKALAVLGQLGSGASSIVARVAKIPERFPHRLASVAFALSGISPASLQLLFPHDARQYDQFAMEVVIIGEVIIPVVEHMVIGALDVQHPKRFAWGIDVLLQLGALEEVGRWIARAPEPVPFPYEFLAGLRDLIERRANMSTASLLALANWQPALRDRVAAQLANRTDLEDEAIPVLIGWLSSTDARLPAADALTAASATRPWLHSLLLQRLATLTPDDYPVFSDRLSAGLQRAMRSAERTSLA